MLSNGFMTSCHSYEMYKSRLFEVEQDADGFLKVNGCLPVNHKELESFRHIPNPM